MIRDQAPTIGLSVLCAGLVLGLGLELTARPNQDTSPPPQAVALPPLPPIPAFVPASVTELSSRPLFTATRRPASIEAPEVKPAAVVVVPPPPPPATELTLIGVIDGTGERLAVIRIQGAAEPRRVTEGATIDRWTVARIAADHVVLSAGGIEQDLHFPPPRAAQAQPGRPRLNIMPQGGPRP